MKHNDEKASIEVLLRLLGPDDFLRLVEAYGGIRLFVPSGNERTDLIGAIGEEAALKLSDRWGGFHIRVPLAREFRARHYRAIGMSNAQIARRLGMAETGINRLFGRMDSVPIKGSRDPRQIELFE